MWNMFPLLPTPPPCVAILLASKSPPPKPSRADADERWDARKNIATKSLSKPGRADTNERWWDGNRSSSPGRAPSCDRWYTSKTNATASFSSSSSGSSSASRASLGKKWGRTAATASRASSAERWDAHLKKPCPLQGGGSDDVDGQSSTGSNDMELDDVPQRAFDSGPGFVASSPEPSMLPMPSSLMLRVA
jgi:hypothetical protein